MWRGFWLAGLLLIAPGSAARAERIPVKLIGQPMQRSMVARSANGKIIAHVEFSQAVQGDEVSMRLTYRFADGSIDDEMTVYSQQGTFRLVRDHHVEEGPYFAHPVDCTVEAATGLVTSRTADGDGGMHVESEHMDLPDDLANGFVGTLLLNAAPDTAPFRVGMLAPVRGGRLIQLLISPEGEQPFSMAGQTLKAAVFRIHPELGGIVGVIAMLLGIQPKDVMVWVLEGKEPEVVRIVGQIGGYGPVVSSELVGTSFGR